MNEGTRQEFVRKLADLIRTRRSGFYVEPIIEPCIYYPDDIDEISIELRVNRHEARHEFWQLEGTVWAVRDDVKAGHFEEGDYAVHWRRSGYSHEDWERMRESLRYLPIQSVDLVEDPDPATRYGPWREYT